MQQIFSPLMGFEGLTTNQVHLHQIFLQYNLLNHMPYMNRIERNQKQCYLHKLFFISKFHFFDIQNMVQISLPMVFINTKHQYLPILFRISQIFSQSKAYTTDIHSCFY